MGSKMIAIYRNLLQHRDLIRFMAATRRRNGVFKTLLGQSWHVLNPLAQMLIYYFLVVFIFQRGAIEGVHPFIMIMSGIVHYTFLQSCLTTSCNAIVGNEGLLLQIPLRPIIFTATAFLSLVRNFGTSLLIMILAYVWMGPELSWRLAYYPLILAVLFGVCWSGSILLSSLSVFFRDVSQMASIALRMLMYLSPVVYGLAFVPERFRDLYLLNPIGCLFALFQWCLLGGMVPPAGAIMSMAVSFSCLCVLAHVVYLRSTPRFTKAF